MSLSREILYQFTGVDVVREFTLDRSDDQLRLTFTFKGREGEAQLLFVNAFPVDGVYSILEADEVWILDDDEFIDGGRIKVEYWVDGLHQFTADNVFDLEEAEYDFQQDDVRYKTGPIDPELIKTRPPSRDGKLTDKDIKFRTGPVDAEVVQNHPPAFDEDLSEDDIRFRTGPIDTSEYSKK